MWLFLGFTIFLKSTCVGFGTVIFNYGLGIAKNRTLLYSRGMSPMPIPFGLTPLLELGNTRLELVTSAL